MNLKHTILPLLMGMAFAVCEAAPINYTINFTSSNGGPLPTAGSFTYDSATPTFSNFQVTYLGTNFDLTAAANSPFVLGAACGGANPSSSFALLTKADACGQGTNYQFGGADNNNGIGNIFYFYGGRLDSQIQIRDEVSVVSITTRTLGDWTVTQDRVEGVPEPASILVTISGGVALLLLRRRATR